MTEERTGRARRWLLLAAAVLLGVIVAVSLQVDTLEPLEPFATDREASVIAHAGAQGHAPGNTLPAFAVALEQGADTLEMDLQITADGHIVVIHDGTVDRTTDGTGAVADLTLEELRTLDAGWAFQDADGDHPYRGEGVTIPTLDEVLEAFPDTPLIVELKLDGGEAIIQPVIDLVAASGRQESIAIASFDEDYLRPVRDQLPDVATNMPESETFGFYVRQLAGLHPWWSPPGELFQVPEEFDGRQVVTRRFTRAAERLGVEVQVWTVNEPEDMHRILDAGAHGIMTDHPDRLVEVLAEREAAAADDPLGYGTQLDRATRLQADRGWLTPFFVAISFLGDEEFYLLLLPPLYWAVSRRMGLRLGVMLLLTAGINGVLKLWWATPRPTFLSPDVGVVPETSFGVPSGHAQNAAAIWGLLAVSVRSWPVRLGAVALIGLIGWSRIHLGVHFLEDILIGWLVGAVLVGLFVWLEGPIRRWLGRQAPADQMLTAVVVSLAMIAPAFVLSGRLRGVRFPWPELVDPLLASGASHVVTPAATLAGFGIGLVLLARGGGFDHRGPIVRRVLRVVAGLVVLVVIWQGLGAVFPGGEEPLDLLLRYLRYALVGAWVGGIAPLAFVRVGLADAAPAGATVDEPAQAVAGRVSEA
jgi:glycerophosphoryl diester phosphodiesterase/membrane-associated phospholipid phosphatase